MTATETRPTAPAPERRSGELTLRELLRWAWRQLTSMRTALILLLILALGAVPGSVIPQERVDALKAGQWQDRHTTLTPIYERLDLFNVYGSPWFAAIYLLLVVSLLGCIIPRTFHYLRAIRSPPPAAPRHLTRLRDHASYGTDEPPEVVLERAREVLRKRRYRLRVADADAAHDSVSGEKGYLREVGNLVFHLAVMAVLVGFAIGSLFGYKGGVILITGDQFSNTLTQYDDFVPGTLFQPSQMNPFRFTVDNFAVDWLSSGMARGFDASMRYTTSLDDNATEKKYDLRVNHPLTIGSTELFLIGHGYAPVITIRDGTGRVVYDKATVFLPQGSDFFSFGVIAQADARPGQIGLEGFFYPAFAKTTDGQPVNLGGKDINPLVSLDVYTGDLGLDSGVPQSVYTLDKAHATQVKGTDGKALRLNLKLGQTATLPNGLGTVTFDSVGSWQRIQISQTPGKRIALGGVVLALIGLLGSLFIRARRVWVRAVAGEGGTVVEIAVLDRSGGADVTAVLSEVVAALQRQPGAPTREKEKT